MLIIISDLHLTDHSYGATISEYAFEIFRQRIRDIAYEASWRKGNVYKPIDQIDIILLGDILDVIRSNKWDKNGVYPWDKSDNPLFAETVKSITNDIIKMNEGSLSILRSMTSGEKKYLITLPPAIDNKPAKVGHEAGNEARVVVKTNIHYMCGNHDWFYHIPGNEYNEIRQLIINAIGLSNDIDKPFPWIPSESKVLENIMQQHSLYAVHGDKWDSMNYEGNRDASSLGDAIVVNLLNRFPDLVESKFGNIVSPQVIDSLKEIDNVRPLTLIPIWIDSVLDKYCDVENQKKIKKVWDDVVDQFIKTDFVKKHHKRWKIMDDVDKLEFGLHFSKKISFNTLAFLTNKFLTNISTGDSAYREKAMNEKAFKEGTRFIVYGHTHSAETIPLDNSQHVDQIYINSGTWRQVDEKALIKKKIPAFISTKVMTYLSFFKDDERAGRSFEVWTGSLA